MPETLGALTAFPDDLNVVSIDLSEDDKEVVDHDGVQIEKQHDGSVVVNFDPQSTPALNPTTAGHDDNLALYVDDTKLDAIGQQLVEDYESDLQSREAWDKRRAKGIKLMGVVDDDTAGPFEGASRVIHPILGEAIVQFGARAIAELWPAGGPVKQKIFGKKTEAKLAQARRATSYMNWQYTEEMPEAFDALDDLLLWLPIDGSAFKKNYISQRLGRTTTELVKAKDFIIHYNSKTLATTPRYTHRLDVHRNDLLKDIQSGFYRKIPLNIPSEKDDTETDGVVDDAEGLERIILSDSLRNAEYEVLEMHVDWDLAGFNDRGEDGNETGIALPYIITIEKESQKILSIKRNWKEDDPNKIKHLYFTHYKYLPGLGFYGFGLLHMIGGLAKAATGALRALLDAAQFANMQGGFKSKDAKITGGTKIVSPGQWLDTDLTGEELKKAFFSVPYEEPSLVLFQLLGFLVDAGQRFAGTTEALVGDAKNTGPVGTTVALIEQGSKVFSSIHKRIHRAQGQEFRFHATLNFELLKSGTQYPFEVEGEDQHVLREDFDGRIDIAPVSDPNIFSQTQRIAMAQGVLDASELAPDLYDKRAVHVRMLTALGTPDIEELLPDKTKVILMSSIEENMAMLHNKPIKAEAQQEHKAHMKVHETWFSSLPPAGQKMLEPVFVAHLAEHIAWDYYFSMQQKIGRQLPPPPNFAESNADDMRGGEIPQNILSQIDLAAANAAQIMSNEKPPSEEELKARTDDKRIDADKEVRTLEIEMRDQRERQTNVAKIENDRENSERKDQTERVKVAKDVQMTREDREHETELARVAAQGDRDAAAIQARADVKIAADDRAAEKDIADADREADSDAKEDATEATIEIAEKQQKTAVKIAKEQPAPSTADTPAPKKKPKAKAKPKKK